MDFHYNYSYSPSAGGVFTMIIGLVFLVYILVLMAALMLLVVEYILQSVGMYTMGKRMGKENAWLAFVPFARGYFQGELSGEILLKHRRIKDPGIWNVILPVAGGAVYGIIIAVLMFLSFMSRLVVIRQGTGMLLFASILLYMTGIAALIVSYVLRYLLLALINKQIFERFTTSNMAVLHSVASLFVPLYGPICFFWFRNADFLQEEPAASKQESVSSGNDTGKTE